MAAALIASIDPLRRQLAGRRQAKNTIGLVPTMGALHAGHVRLIEVARRECQTVVVSIFVNPLQFDRPDDLQRYPRTLTADRAVCDDVGVDIIFAPPVEEMYPVPPACTIDVGPLADRLCGPFRPGHFQSVATVVMKLFDIAQPDRAYFGEKDAQQLAIIRRMVADFNVPVQITGVATVREADGLALSSRNLRLSAAERTLSVALYGALQTAARLIAAGETDAARVARDAAATIPADPALRLEYLEIVDPADLRPVERIVDAGGPGDRVGPVLIAGALWVGSTRLIDNVRVTPGRPR
jgi:pantoate--beta-alanine ligase